MHSTEYTYKLKKNHRTLNYKCCYKKLKLIQNNLQDYHKMQQIIP